MTAANEVATRSVPPELLEKVIIEGDLEKLSAAERMEYYEKVCDSLGLNPLTRPFDYIKLSGKLTLYAKKDATEQLAKMHHVSIKLQPGRSIEGVYLVQATASTEYRSVDATGAVPIESLKGEAKANALMKAETKACRRAVLRLVGLGWLDETEVTSVSDATPVLVDHTTGEIVEAKPPALISDAKAGTVEGLKAHLETLGWTWDSFESEVLGTTWENFQATGGTPGIAWKRFQNYLKQQEGE